MSDDMSIYEPVEGEPAWTLSEELRLRLTRCVRDPIALCRRAFGDAMADRVEATQRRDGADTFMRELTQFNDAVGHDLAPRCMIEELPKKYDEATRFVAALLGQEG